MAKRLKPENLGRTQSDIIYNIRPIIITPWVIAAVRTFSYAKPARLLPEWYSANELQPL